MYDPHKSYVPSDFEKLSPVDLSAMFKSAKNIVHISSGSKRIRKIMKDISTMRGLLKGMNGLYNLDHVTTSRHRGKDSD